MDRFTIPMPLRRRQSAQRLDKEILGYDFSEQIGTDAGEEARRSMRYLVDNEDAFGDL